MVLRSLAPQAYLYHLYHHRSASVNRRSTVSNHSAASGSEIPESAQCSLADAFAHVHHSATNDAHGHSAAAHCHPASSPQCSAPGRVCYSGSNPPYITACAASLLAALGARALVLDLPSPDREDDAGAVAAHHAFFRSRWWRAARTAAADAAAAAAGASETETAAAGADARARVLRSACDAVELSRLRAEPATVTELAWLPAPPCSAAAVTATTTATDSQSARVTACAMCGARGLRDGPALLALGVPAVESDAAPARPLLAPAVLTVTPPVSAPQPQPLSLSGQ